MKHPELWKKNLAFQATALRMILVPAVIVFFYWNSPWAGLASAICFTFASITDYYDGHWARKYGSVSTMGKFLDPVADKLLVSSTLIMMVPGGKIEAIMVVLLLGRDTLIGGVRAIAATQNIVIAAGPLGKWKTGFQMVGIPCLLIYEPLFGLIPIAVIGRTLMWLSVVMSLVSGWTYFNGFWKSQLTHKP